MHPDNTDKRVEAYIRKSLDFTAIHYHFNFPICEVEGVFLRRQVKIDESTANLLEQAGSTARKLLTRLNDLPGFKNAAISAYELTIRVVPDYLVSWQTIAPSIDLIVYSVTGVAREGSRHPEAQEAIKEAETESAATPMVKWPVSPGKTN